MEKATGFLSKFEETLESFSTPLKPWLPVIARFLLVVTFLEDSLRIISQWSDQLFYLQRHRGFPWITAEAFLVLNVALMVVSSFMAIAKFQTKIAVGALFFVVVSQAIGYGLIFDMNFLFRNISVIGGLLMLLADASLTNSGRKKNSYDGALLNVNVVQQGEYILLAGRVLLVFLFLSFIFGGELTPLRILVSIVSGIGCIMVVVGFKAKWSAWILITFLSISNFFLNNWWNLHHNHPQKDFQKYDFFQTLSIMGGFLLLVNLGPGGLSMDEKKKDY
ncbi:SURF4 family-domain-containing protein [Polychytrium aggregatum]|uniref:SURF4 family-domain-containing protein n=1 Tax=Polychytrium aggregatum TaxID=110093 RepID=UPI0022FE1344|nr:SURF4 family-domain-containing protein [Polychytrium aggregatum]KAI9197419.1 SURF4 family-domain-containing protein [Polychytrium aggregatum]